MSVDIKGVSEMATLPPPPNQRLEKPPKRILSAGEAGELRDKTTRHIKATKAGLDPDASWEDINRRAAEITRRLVARKLCMDTNSSWDEIMKEERKRR